MKTRIEELEKQLQIEKENNEKLKVELNNLREFIKNKYPKSKWIDLWVRDEDIYVNQLRYDKKYLTFAALIETCKEWNMIDGFEPDWNSDKEKVCICLAENKVQFGFATTVSRPLCFENTKTAQQFLDTHRTELEQVKDLI